MIVYCANCTGPFDVCVSRINRAATIGAPLYCGRMCAGMARRSALDGDERKAAKAAYDRSRRAEHGDAIRAQKRNQYHATKIERSEVLKAYRRKRQKKHNEYCRSPEYRAYKAEYDRNRRAELQFGPFAESFLALQCVERQLDSQATKYERMLVNGTINKAQTRRRAL